MKQSAVVEIISLPSQIKPLPLINPPFSGEEN